MYGRLTQQKCRELQKRVKLVLSRHPVTRIRVVPYQNFVLECAKALHRMPHKEMLLYVRTRVEWRVKQGLRREVLKDLLYNLLNVRLP